MKRRTIWVTGVAAAAGTLGAGLAWWRLEPHAVDASAEAAFWATRLEGLDGQPMDLAAFRGRPLLVNFWATWCPPCVEELPLLNAFYREQAGRGWQVLGLAVDKSSAVQTFLRHVPLEFPVGMAGFSGTELSRTLGNPSGGLPYTVVFGADGNVKQRKVGKISPDDLKLWTQQD